MRAYSFVLTAILFLPLFGPSNLFAREWTDASGSYRVQADLLDFSGGIVRLVKEDGKVVSIPLNKLSSADQAYVRKQETGSKADRGASRDVRHRSTLAGHTKVVKAVTFSPDGKTIATGSWDGTVKLWDVTTGRERRNLQAFPMGVNAVTFAPDGQTLAAGGWKNATIMRWNPTTGENMDALPQAEGSYGINAVAFSPDGKILAAACSDTTAKLWDLRAGKPSATLAGHTHFVLSVAISPDGEMAATGSFDGETIKLWDVRRAQVLATLKSEGGPITSVVFSPDGKTLATGGWDGVVELWDCHTRKAKLVFHGHAGNIQSLVFSPDGKLLVTGSTVGDPPPSLPTKKTRSSQVEVKLWDPNTGKELASIPSHLVMVEAVAFSPDGRILASAGMDANTRPSGTVELWDVGPTTNQPVTAK